VSSTKKNISYNLIYQIFAMLIPFITAPYLSRVIGTDGIGIYSYTFSIANYFVLFAKLGISNYGNRSIAKVRDDREQMDKTFSGIYCMQILSSIVVIGLYALFIIFYGGEYKTIFSIQFCLVLSSLFDVSWFFFGIEQFKTSVIRSTIIKLVMTASIFIFVKNPDDLWKYVSIMSLQALASQLILWFLLRKYVTFYIPKIKDILLHFKPNIILFIPVIAVSLYRMMDKIMLGLMSTMTQTGLYENSDKLVTLPLTVITAIGMVMMPKMANLYARGKDELSEIYIRDSMQLVIAISVAMAFGIAAISIRFAPLYFGAEFTYSGTLIRALSPVIIFSAFANVIRTQYLIPLDKDKSYAVSVLFGAAVNLVVNALLIPRYASMGAVIGTLCAEFSVMFIQSFSVRKDLKFKQYIYDGWVFIFSGFLMYFIVTFSNNFISDNLLGILLQIIIGMVSYIAISLLLGIIFYRDRFKYLYHVIGLERIFNHILHK